MKTFNLPSKIPSNIKGFIFDIDSTLYTSPKYAFEQVDCQVREFAKLRGISADEARKMVADYRKKFAEEHNGSKVSLGNTLLNFGIPIEQSIEWRKTLLSPQKFLDKDNKLIAELKTLSRKYKLICVTNNPVLPARKTLEALGVSEFFENIVGLDTCKKSKPAKEPFIYALKLLHLHPEECIAVGDRFDLDIALPLDMGMAGILVNGVEEVYQISKLCDII